MCTDIVLHAEFKKGMRALASANHNFWPRTAIFSTTHVRCNDIVRAVLRWMRSADIARTLVLLNPALSIFTIYPTLSISIQKQFLERVRVRQKRERETERERNAGKNIAYNIVGDSFSAIAPGVYTAICLKRYTA